MIIRQGESPVEQLGQKPVYVKSLLSRTHTDAVSVTWVRMDGRCCQRMACELSDRVYYLLEGSGQFQVGSDPVETVGCGDLVFIPRGEAYSFGGDMTYLVMNVPAFVPGSDTVVE